MGCASATRALFDAQGHRGARGLLPENTLPAFERAIALGVTTLELDVGMTRDGVVVVSHDPALSPKVCLQPDGTTLAGERGPLLRDLDWDTLRRYDCGSLNPDPQRFPEPPRENRPGTPMPTLDQVFALAERDADLRFNVETKIRPGDRETVPAEAMVRAVVERVREHGLQSRVSIQSFDWRALVQTRALAPEIETVALVAPDTLEPEWLAGLEPDASNPLALFREARPFLDSVSPHWRMLVAENGPALPLAGLQAEGFRVVPWTVNDPETLRRLVRLGVDGLISDYPDRLMQVLREEGVPVR
ncbi:MAG: glycerophosphodiester phosphodiesterase family protein [Myxococcota bacterium]